MSSSSRRPRAAEQPEPADMFTVIAEMGRANRDAFRHRQERDLAVRDRIAAVLEVLNGEPDDAVYTRTVEMTGFDPGRGEGTP